LRKEKRKLLADQVLRGIEQRPSSKSFQKKETFGFAIKQILSQDKILYLFSFLSDPIEKKLITCSSFSGGKKLWCKATLGEERTSHQKKQYT
jgi:hypothetical protein